MSVSNCNLEDVAQSVDHLHTIFTTLFPTPARVADEGVRLFIALPEFAKTGELIKKIKSWNEDNESYAEFSALWKECDALFREVIREGRWGRQKEINRSFEYFYAASALTRIWLSARFKGVADRDKITYIEETVPSIAKRCNVPELLGHSVEEAMHALAGMQAHLIQSFAEAGSDGKP